MHSLFFNQSIEKSHISRRKATTLVVIPRRPPQVPPSCANRSGSWHKNGHLMREKTYENPWKTHGQPWKNHGTTHGILIEIVVFFMSNRRSKWWFYKQTWVCPSDFSVMWAGLGVSLTMGISHHSIWSRLAGRFQTPTSLRWTDEQRWRMMNILIFSSGEGS